MSEKTEYQVLARKYRPQNFDDLIGQEAMVQTLSNAFSLGRIAHAFILTGVRGIGKTTTARIIAKGMNCIGADGNNTEPTTQPCGECAPCQSITEGRNIDVLELDAASNTQVEKMREILAGVPYRPSETRYKVYIFDEVHMLSNAAFNAILKTLEEPPEHVKFIFATTEIRKIPVTVLSRCQRFDLRRFEPDVMVDFLAGIAAKENAAIAADALRLIARAAEGSARDALSLLDQAIAMGEGEITGEQVRNMMGLADQARILDLFEAVMGGEVSHALELLRGLYTDGADPAAIISELAEVTHLVSLLNVADQLDDDAQSPEDMTRAKSLAARLSLPVLARSWQMLLKLGQEIELSPNRLMGTEMAIIRLCHVADQPPPGELMAKLQAGLSRQAKSDQSVKSESNTEAPRAQKQVGGADITNDALARFTRFDDVVSLIRSNRDVSLLVDVEKHIRLSSYTPGRIEFTLTQDAPSDLPTRLGNKLKSWTGARWGISLVNDCIAPTIEEKRNEALSDFEASLESNPMIAHFRNRFLNAKIIDIALAPVKSEDNVEAPDDDWDAIDFDDIG